MCLTLKMANQTFLHAPKFKLMHHTTTFGNKMFGSLEDIIWTNTNSLTLHCNLDLQSSYPIFFQKTLWLMMMYHQTMFGCGGINKSEDIAERVTF